MTYSFTLPFHPSYYIKILYLCYHGVFLERDFQFLDVGKLKHSYSYLYSAKSLSINQINFFSWSKNQKRSSPSCSYQIRFSLKSKPEICHCYCFKLYQETIVLKVMPASMYQYVLFMPQYPGSVTWVLAARGCKNMPHSITGYFTILSDFKNFIKQKVNEIKSEFQSSW